MPYFSILLELGHTITISKLRWLIMYLNTIQMKVRFSHLQLQKNDINLKVICARTVPLYSKYTKDLISFYDHKYVKFQGLVINSILHL